MNKNLRDAAQAVCDLRDSNDLLPGYPATEQAFNDLEEALSADREQGDKDGEESKDGESGSGASDVSDESTMGVEGLSESELKAPASPSASPVSEETPPMRRFDVRSNGTMAKHSHGRWVLFRVADAALVYWKERAEAADRCLKRETDAHEETRDALREANARAEAYARRAYVLDETAERFEREMIEANARAEAAEQKCAEYADTVQRAEDRMIEAGQTCQQQIDRAEDLQSALDRAEERVLRRFMPGGS
jgi:hypothetical protein